MSGSTTLGCRPPMTPLVPAPPGPLTCTRCGSFLQPAELRMLFNKPFCATCAARPDVDYLEAFRLKYWGKRDSWAWLVGFGTPFTALAIIGTIANGFWLNLPGQLASLVCGAAFFFGFRWARFGMLGAFVLNLLFLVQTPQLAILGAISLVFGLAVWVAIIRSTLNKLFFKLDCSRDELQKAWDLFANNTLARAGFLLGMTSLMMPPMALIALPVSIVGLTRVNPNAMPPIGRKGQAIAGIVFSCLAIALGGWLVFTMSQNH